MKHNNQNLKKEKIFICNNCGAKYKKWVGRCSKCLEWNSISEEIIVKNSKYNNLDDKINDNDKIELCDFNSEIVNYQRIKTNIDEFDKVIGGGIVPSSVILIGGDPGVGKSTLLLQICKSLTINKNKIYNILYISGEESSSQIKIRWDRISMKDKDNIKIDNSNLKLCCANNLTKILSLIENIEIDIMIIDSIQCLYIEEISSMAGSISQVKACCYEIIELSRKKNIASLIVSHVNKDGQIAGPKLLEHMVDAVLYFEGNENYQLKILRSIKNRYGRVNEIAIFEIYDDGLYEVKNPNNLFLQNNNLKVSGNVVTAIAQGSRIMLIEIQSLITNSFMPIPKRTAIGIDINRLSLIIAVLAARLGINLSNKEIYINITGGIKIYETSADLAVAISIISSVKNTPIDNSIIAIGEISLSGEVKIISMIEERINEALRLGFSQFIISSSITNLKNYSNIYKNIKKSDAKMILISHIKELFTIIK